MKRVIMTGGTGFIGKHLVKYLISKGVDVTLLTHDISNVKHESELLHYIVVDYSDLNSLIDEISGEFDVFYHLGWEGVTSDNKNNIDMQLRNIETSVSILRLSKAINCKKTIAAGTVAEYVFEESVIDFNNKQTPNDLYGAAKVAVHYLLEAIGNIIEQELVWVVLPSTFGEGRREDNILTYTIVKLLKGEKPVYGDLKQIWDFLYVEEVARALYLLGEMKLNSNIYGIGSGVYKPLKDYIEATRDLIDPNLALGIGEKAADKSRVVSACVNIDQLTRDTGFVPQISFEEGIKKTIDFYRGKYDE